MNRFLPLWIGLLVLIADVATKYLTHHYLPLIGISTFLYPYGGIAVFQDFFGIDFSINHHINTGAAWGLFKQYQLPLLYLRMGLLFFLIVFATRFNKNSKWDIPFALIIAGAIGNILDYFLYGHVIDMIHFVLWGYDFPVFNLADSAIFLGIFSLFFLSKADSSNGTRCNKI